METKERSKNLMAITEIEKRSYFLTDLWGKQLVARDEGGLLVISREMENEIERLVKLVKFKKKDLSDRQIARAERAKEMGSKLGRQKVKLPVSVAELRKMLQRPGATFHGVAKELKINRRTMENRLNEASVLGDEIAK